MTRNICLFLLGFAFCGIADAQSEYFKDDGENNFTLKFDYKNEYENNNEILKLLAKAESKEAEKFHVSYLVKFKLTGQVEKKNNMQVYFSSVELMQAIKYKQFDLNDLMLPGKADFVLIRRNAGKDIVKTYPAKRVSIKIGDTYSEKITDPDTTGTYGSKLEMVELALHFDDKGLKSIKEKMATVDDYYNSDLVMKELIQSLKAIDPDQIEKVTEYLDKVKAAGKTIENTEDKKLSQKLSLHLFDPIGMGVTLKEAKNLHKGISDTLQSIANHLYLAWYNQAKKLHAEKMNKEALERLQKCIALKNDFVPAYLEKALILQEDGNFLSSLEVLKTVFTTLKNTPDEKLTIQNLTLKVVDKGISDANVFCLNQNFESAIVLLDSCSSIARQFGKLTLSSTFQDVKKKAYQGKYGQIGNSASQFMVFEKVQEGLFIVDSAHGFALKNLDWVGDTLLTHGYYEKIMILYFEKGKALLQEKKFMLAREPLESALKIGLTHSLEVSIVKKQLYENDLGIVDEWIKQADGLFREEKLFSALQLLQQVQEMQLAKSLPPDGRLIDLLLLINGKRYENLVQQGRQSLDKQLCDEALQFFESAMEVEKNLPNQVKTDLRPGLVDAAKCYVFQLIKSAEKEAGRNRLNEARRYYAISQNVLNRYQIVPDSLIESRFLELNQSIFSQECKNAQFNFEIQLSAALKFIEQKNFIEADNSLNKAVRISDENAKCQIVTIEALEKKSDIKQAIVYQSKMKEIDRLIEKENFPDFLVSYEDARKFHEDNNLTRFNVNHLPFYDFVKNQQPTNFINEAIEYFCKKSELDAALNLLHELYGRGIAPERTKISQIVLGQEFGAHDATFSPTINPRDQVLKYIKDDSWYSLFKKTYQMEFKKKRK